MFFIAGSSAQEIDDNNLIIYPVPSSKFHNIMLQSHKGLPRFGSLNNYTNFVKINIHSKSRPPKSGIQRQEKKTKNRTEVSKLFQNGNL